MHIRVFQCIAASSYAITYCWGLQGKEPRVILCRLSSCQQVQADIDKKIKWAVDATEGQQKAQSDLESNVAKLQQELKTQVCHLCVALICMLQDQSQSG